MAEVRFWAIHRVFQASSHWQPAVDLCEDSDAFHIIVELAGVDRDEVSVEYLPEERIIRLRGSRRPLFSRPGQYLILEINYGSFQRDIVLPGPVDEEGIKASFRNGILHIIAPRPSPEGPSPYQLQLKGE